MTGSRLGFGLCSGAIRLSVLSFAVSVRAAPSDAPEPPAETQTTDTGASSSSDEPAIDIRSEPEGTVPATSSELAPAENPPASTPAPQNPAPVPEAATTEPRTSDPPAFDGEWLDADSAPEPESNWYGWQTLSVDAVAVLSIAAAVGLNRAEDRCSNDGGGCDVYEGGTIAFALLGAGSFVVGAPILHFSRGYLGKGFGSLGMRLAGPALFLIGAANCNVFGSCPGGPLILAGLAAVPVAIVVDAAWLAYEESDSDDSEFLRLTPTFDPAARRAELRLTGSY